MLKKFTLIIAFIAVIYAHAQPYKTIIVAKDGTGEFASIQEAVNSTRDLGPDWVEIIIKNGIYKEKIRIPSWKHFIHLKGESRENVRIINDDYSGKMNNQSNLKYNTFDSYTLLAEGDHIMIENLTIQNSSCHQGQAVALHVEGDYFIGKNLNLQGCQDTLYAARENSRQYYHNCFIEGTTDFIFGQATAAFENCEIKSLANSYITAAATGNNKAFGFVFLNSRLTASQDVTKVYLGRPWRPYAKTVFIDCWMDQHILPIGWDKWEGDAMFPNKHYSTLYAEFKSSGKGANPTKRAEWSKQLTKKERELYTLENIFNGWNPKLYFK